MAFPAVVISGCATGPVVVPFNPPAVKPEPYNPEPMWNDKTDPYLISIQQIARAAGESMIPTAGLPGGAIGPTNPGGSSGSAEPQPPTPTPGPAPAPPAPAARTPLPTDPVYGVVTDRIEGGVIPNATVTLRERRGALIGTFTTNAYGEYSFTNLTAGNYYQVAASANGYSASPLSTVDFFYTGIPVIANLELVYTKPVQIIEGGNFNQVGGLGNVRYEVRDGTYTDARPVDPTPPPLISKDLRPVDLGIAGVPDAMKTPFYSQATQQTYNSVYFEDIHGDWIKLPGNIYTDPNTAGAPPRPFLMCQNGTNVWTDYAVGPTLPSLDPLPDGPLGYRYSYDTEPWAQYTFSVPAPVANKYSYDGLWVTFPGNFKVDDKGVWSSGGFVRYWFCDWYHSTPGHYVWSYLGNSDTNALGYIDFTGVNPTTGLVSVIAAAYDANPFVITQVQLSYDYRKDTAAPTIYEAHASYVPGLGSNVQFVIKPQEDCFATIAISGGPTYNGILFAAPRALTFDTGLPTGTYSYYMTLTDLPGNTATYGPYSFIIP